MPLEDMIENSHANKWGNLGISFDFCREKKKKMISLSCTTWIEVTMAKIGKQSNKK